MVSTNRGALAEANVALVAQYLEATNAWDFPTMRSLLHEDVLFELPFAPDPFPRATQGIEAVMQFLCGVPAFASEENLYDITIDTLAGDPSEVIAQFRSDMKLISGREYRNCYVLLVTVREGRIIRFAEYFDPIALVRAIGGSVVPPVPPEQS